MTIRDRIRRGFKRSDNAEAGSGAAHGQAPQDRPTDPPGTVSNQNGEEAESALREDETHPEPRSSR